MIGAPETKIGRHGSIRSIGVALLALLAILLENPRSQMVESESRLAGKAPSRFRAFQDTVFALAYEVFLEAQNIPSAFELAKEAVQQRPDLHAWRERYARTAEWIGNPALAQVEWQTLGEQTQQARAFREALRLAGLLRNPSASVRAWESLDKIQPLDSSEWSAFIEAFEASGQMDRCIRLLKRKLSSRFEKHLAMALVEIHIRTDNDLEAMDLLSKMDRQFGKSQAFSLQQARIYLRHGKLRETALILDSLPVSSASDSTHATVLRMKASVYSSLQRNGDALQAFRQLFTAGQYTADDLREMNTMARALDPEFALRTAIAGWTQFRDVNHLIYYLERCIGLSRWDLASRQLSRLKPEQWSWFEDTPYFFILASRIHQQEGKPELARKEYRRALQLEPDLEEYQAGYLWLIVEQGQLQVLAALVDSLGQGPATPKPLLEPLATAYLVLQRQTEAMAYFRLLRESKDAHDFPFLLRYAEILKAAGDGGGSERAYRRALVARREREDEKDPESHRDWLESEVKWLHTFGKVDQTEATLAGILRRYPEDRSLRELAFQLKTQRGVHPEAAMHAVQQQSGWVGPFSPWAKLAVALQKEDAEGVSQLLNEPGSKWTPEDRERALELMHHARQPAFTRASSEVRGGVHFDFHPFYDENLTDFEIQAPYRDGLDISFSGLYRQRPWISPELLAPAAKQEMSGKIGLHFSTAKSQTRAWLGLRNAASMQGNRADDKTLTYEFESDWQPVRELLLTAGYAHHARAEENPILALASLKDDARIQAKLNMPWNASFSLGASRNWFRSWDQHFLGQGNHVQATLEHTVSTPFHIGAGIAYHYFSPGAIQSGPLGQNKIGGILSPQEFPRTYAHAKAYAEWLHLTRNRMAWIPAPIGSLEMGRNGFFASASNNPLSTYEYALRGGFVVQPGRFQTLTLLAEYTQGLHGRRETESALSMRYGYTLN
jgi:tetratricopeptide (TPR) repeat protein